MFFKANKSRYQFSQKCKPLEVIDPISPCESKIIGAKVSQQINSDREKSIVISLENTPYFIFHESPIMSTTSYISSFGGSIGVWLGNLIHGYIGRWKTARLNNVDVSGASFMAFFHVFVSVFATVFGCGKQWMGKRKTKVSQEASKKAEVYDEPEPTTLTIH